MNQLIDKIEGENLRTDLPNFKVGDTISVYYRIIEGEKERVQIFTGTVIARKGRGISESISVYRISYGSAMERVFPLHSPRVAKIEVMKQGKVRKSKLYHLRGKFGKKAKVQERIGKGRHKNQDVQGVKKLETPPLVPKVLKEEEKSQGKGEE